MKDFNLFSFLLVIFYYCSHRKNSKNDYVTDYVIIYFK